MQHFLARPLRLFGRGRSRWFGLGLIVVSVLFGTVALAQQTAPPTPPVPLTLKAELQRTISPFPGKTHLLPATLETTQWGWFDNAQPPVLSINSGDTVVVETMMHSHNQVIPGKSVDELKKLRTDNPGRGPHTLTGPIYVKGAEPGDVLKVKVLRIEPRAYAANFNLPGMFGAFPDKFPDGQVKYLYLDMNKKTARFAPGIEIPLNPFPGTLGVARAEPGRYSSVPPGPYAGNLDIRDFTAGSTIYIPVFVKGALLWTGDSHAAQGNGEINLTALETAFKEIVLNVEVIKNKPQSWPKIETPTHWITLGVDKDLNKALEIATAETTKFLAEQRKLTPEQAATLMTQVSDCRISQIVNVSRGVHCLNPKDIKAQRTTEYPTVETPEFLVTTETDADLNKAMLSASMQMIELLQAKKKLSRLDAYGLASATMDCRIGAVTPATKSVHCVVPKSLWVASR